MRVRSLRPLIFAAALGGVLTTPVFAAWPPAVPSDLILTVRETAGIARVGEVVSSGVPLPRELGILGVDDLVVVDGFGTPVPAQFQVAARWHTGVNGSGPIQWLRVSFAATVPANGSIAYRLVTDGSAGSNPPPAQPLSLVQNGNQVTVDTGVARFVLGGNAGALFDEVRLGSGTLLASAGAMTATTGGTPWGHPTTREVSYEHTGPLHAVVTVTGAYAMPAVGGGGLGSERRYVFSAGSPTVVVRQAVAWEGDRCGIDQRLCPGGAVNGVLFTRVRDTLPLALGASLDVTAVGAFGGAASTGTASGAQTAHVRQRLRASRTAPLLFQVSVPGSAGATGAKADGGVLAASGPAGAVAIAANHLHRYEPQALRLLAGGVLAVDLADDSVWVANHQGMFASFAVSALPSGPSRAVLDRQVWAPLNRPLRAWPSPEWFASSQAVEEFPVGPLPANLAGYDAAIEGVLDSTLQKVDLIGIAGLMTYGVFPRNWGDPLYSDEVDCGPDGDPTPAPADEWDDVFWCSSWTDYHNAAATAVVWAMRSGEVEWLDEIATPAALRTLYTQVVQCAPGDPYFFCGQAPTGYGAYRSDNNGSHAYFDNLFLYSWLANDESTHRSMLRGARTMAGFLCPARFDPSAPVCAPTTPISDVWASINGRVAVQWYRAFRYFGLATADEFLDDWSSNLARHLTLYHAAPLAAGGTGAARGFNVPSGGGSLDYVDGPGTYFTNQLWMDALYDYDLLHRWRIDSQDAPLGSPALQPSAVEIAWARVLADVAVTGPFANGGPTGWWPNGVSFTFSGPRVGGSLDAFVSQVDADGDGNPCELNDDDGDGNPDTYGDPCLYNPGKATLGAALLRAADAGAGAAVRALGVSFAEFGIQSGLPSGLPLGKNSGIAFSRLHAAVARAAGAAGAPLFADGFESGDTAAWDVVIGGP